VTKRKSPTALVEVGLYSSGADQSRTSLHVFLEVTVEEFEYEVEFAIGLDAVLELDDVGVGEFAEEGYFA